MEVENETLKSLLVETNAKSLEERVKSEREWFANQTVLIEENHKLKEEIEELKVILNFERNSNTYNFEQLEEANELIEKYEKVLKNISEMKTVGFNPEYVVKRYSEYAENALNGIFED